MTSANGLCNQLMIDPIDNLIDLMNVCFDVLVKLMVWSNWRAPPSWWFDKICEWVQFMIRPNLGSDPIDDLIKLMNWSDLWFGQIDDFVKVMIGSHWWFDQIYENHDLLKWMMLSKSNWRFTQLIDVIKFVLVVL